MEWLTLGALLFIGLSNIFVGIKDKTTQPTKDEKYETLRLQSSVLECALKNALQEIPQPKAPVVTVLAEPSDVSFDLDYEKLGAAIKRALMEAQIAIHNANIPPTTHEAVPYWQAPVTSREQTVTHTLSTNVEIEGVPAKQYPRSS